MGAPPSDTNIDLFCDESLENVLEDTNQQQENLQSENVLQRNENAYDPFDPIKCFAIESDELDYIRNLANKETVFVPRTSDRNTLLKNAELQETRSNCVQWILNAQRVHGYKLLTAYLSVAYFDRYLSEVYPIHNDGVWVACVVCLALAAKFEEGEAKSFSKLAVGERHFDTKALVEMEILVLNKLGWRLFSITPFAYLHYFIVKMCAQSIPSKIGPKAEEYIMESVKEYGFLYHVPSVVAAAAVLAAFSAKLIRNEFEAKLAAISSIGPLNTDDVFFCYTEMVNMEMRKHETPSDLCPIPINRTLRNVASSIRRLQFDDNDQRSPSKRTRL